MLPGERPEWHAHAACRGKTRVFFADRFESADPARALCAACPVRELCLDAGMFEQHGVWAGLTPLERRDIRMGRREAS